jgi:hypothetical protein
VTARHRIAVVLTAAALVAWPATPASAGHAPAPRAFAARTCSAGYKHAVIGGQQKCLHAGEFCAHRYDSQYRRYGYRCTRYYANVDRYRLTHA